MAASDKGPSLLPQRYEDFRDRSYWDSFFAKRGGASFEWYGEWSDLRDAFRAVVPDTARVLVIGCGNSELSERLFDMGVGSIVSVDFSEPVIAEMRTRTASKPAMEWAVEDVRHLSFASESFDVVVDKGTLDAIHPEGTEAGRVDAELLLREALRVIRTGGAYVCVSLLQRHIREVFLSDASGSAEEAWVMPFDPAHPSPVCPFVVALRKGRQDDAAVEPQPSPQGVTWRLVHSPKDLLASSRGVPFTSRGELFDALNEEMWHYRSRTALLRVVPGQYETIELGDSRFPEAGPRFTLFVVDAAASAKGCAALVIPSGRETEWMFGTQSGQEELAKSSGYGRLILVRCNRGHEFGSQEGVRAELAAQILRLTPSALRDASIPWLGLEPGPPCEVVAELESPQSGRMVVEDIPDGDKDFPRTRRLVFFSNQGAIQSQAVLTGPSAKKRKDASAGSEAAPFPSPLVAPSAPLDCTGKPPRVDYSSLAFEFHQAVVAALSISAMQSGARAANVSATGGAFAPAASGLADGRAFRVNLLGLGGGGLAMFLTRGFSSGTMPVLSDAAKSVWEAGCHGGDHSFGQMAIAPSTAKPHLLQLLPAPLRLHAVEIDPVVALVAQQFFAFEPQTTDGRCVLSICDAVDHIKVRADLARTEVFDADPWHATSVWQQDAIVVDIDAKNVTSGLSFPPKVSEWC
jgi:ubiquinone/menaquinone biosynthesis C-methylase UbiE